MSADAVDSPPLNGESKSSVIMEPVQSMVNTAILVDFDSIDTRRLIGWIDRFQLENRLLIKRAYRDWTAGNHSTVQALMRAAIELIQVPVFNDRGNKNGVDIRLAIDAVEISLRKPHIERFIIFGSDSDYISLVIRLKEHNKEVIFVGNKGSTSPGLVGYCDQFYFLTDIDTDPSEEESENPEERVQEITDSAELFNRAISTIQSQGQTFPIQGSNLHDVMRRLNPSFDYKRLGYNTWTDFLREFESNGTIVIRLDRNGNKQVDLPRRGGGNNNQANLSTTTALYPSDILNMSQLYVTLANGRTFIAHSELIQTAKELQKKQELKLFKADPVAIVRAMVVQGLLKKFNLNDNPYHEWVEMSETQLAKVKDLPTPEWAYQIIYRKIMASYRIPVDLSQTLLALRLIETMAQQGPIPNRDAAYQYVLQNSQFRADKLQDHFKLIKDSGIIDFDKEPIEYVPITPMHAIDRLCSYIVQVLRTQKEKISLPALFEIYQNVSSLDEQTKKLIQDSLQNLAYQMPVT
jgi:hypothetical protein